MLRHTLDHMPHILVVCTGNVCRSPLIERYLQREMDAAYGPGTVEVRSAGTGALADHAMDERSAAILTDLGGDPSGFLGRRLTPAMLRDTPLVITATRDHRAAVVKMHPKALRTAFTLRELAHLGAQMDTSALPADPAERLAAVAREGVALRGTNARLAPEDLDVVDPYRRSDETYALMRAQLEPALAQVASVLAPPRGDCS